MIRRTKNKSLTKRSYLSISHICAPRRRIWDRHGGPHMLESRRAHSVDITAVRPSNSGRQAIVRRLPNASFRPDRVTPMTVSARACHHSTINCDLPRRSRWSDGIRPSSPIIAVTHTGIGMSGSRGSGSVHSAPRVRELNVRA